MPALFCDLSRDATARLPEYALLRAAGEAIALFWPVVATVLAELYLVRDAAALQACWEDDKLALIAGPELPAWLPLGDFHRVLLIASPPLRPRERQLADQLLCGGCEAVEVLLPADVCGLTQSWNSGRRTGTAVLRP